MAVLIDPPAWPAHGRLWSHLVSDQNLAELHAFAARAGVPDRAFEGDHYDVPAERHADLVAAGAVPVPPRELVRRLQASGLRRPKRRGEQVVASVHHDGQRTDAVLSALAPPGEVDGTRVVAGASGRRLGYLRTLPDGASLAHARYLALVEGEAPSTAGSVGAEEVAVQALLDAARRPRQP